MYKVDFISTPPSSIWAGRTRQDSDKPFFACETLKNKRVNFFSAS